MPKRSTIEAQAQAKREMNIPRRYYLLRDDVGKELGGLPVVQQGQNRIVMMTDAQATYWLDNGAVSLHPPQGGDDD